MCQSRSYTSEKALQVEFLHVHGRKLGWPSDHGDWHPTPLRSACTAHQAGHTPARGPAQVAHQDAIGAVQAELQAASAAADAAREELAAKASEVEAAERRVEELAAELEEARGQLGERAGWLQVPQTWPVSLRSRKQPTTAHGSACTVLPCELGTMLLRYALTAGDCLFATDAQPRARHARRPPARTSRRSSRRQRRQPRSTPQRSQRPRRRSARRRRRRRPSWRRPMRARRRRCSRSRRRGRRRWQLYRSSWTRPGWAG